MVLRATTFLASSLVVAIASAIPAVAGVVFPPPGYLAEEESLTVMLYVGEKDPGSAAARSEDGGEAKGDLQPGFNRWEVTLKPGKTILQWGGETREVFLAAEGKTAPDGFSPAVLHEAMDDCENCHAGGDAGTDLKGELTEVCFECHDDPSAGEEGKKKSVHSPVADDDCLSCHRPHAAPLAGLLELEAPALCFECHDDPSLDGEGNAFPSPHEPVGEGACLDCHSPHASDAPALAVRGGAALCLECHDDFRVDDEGKARKAVHEPVGDGDCTSCHQVHGGAEAPLLSVSEGDLCKECHDDLLEGDDGEPMATVHEPAGSDECLSCHDAHAADSDGMTNKADRELCLECHDDPTLDGSGEAFPVVHAAVEDGCLGCHRPHAAASKGLLASPARTLCLECHDDVRLDGEGFAYGFLHLPVEEGKCVSCHAPHAGPDPKLLLGRESKLCFTCHPEVHQRHRSGEQESVDNTFVPEDFPREKPGFTLACRGCHTAHGSNETGLLTTDQVSLCAMCHRM